jgi:pimeloyl-ACP methyl ester carboxylesterase
MRTRRDSKRALRRLDTKTSGIGILGRIGTATLAILATFAMFAGGCATPVGVEHLDRQAAYRELATNILSAGKPSSYSTQILERTGLSDDFEHDPERTLAQLHSGLGGPDEHDRLFALSELSFACALERNHQSYYLASAVYAYAFLFPDKITDAPNPYDPRLTLALDLYNSGLSSGLVAGGGGEDLSGRSIALPFGSLDLQSDAQAFLYGGYHLNDFASLSDVKVRGLRNIYRRAGLGAAIVGRVEPMENNAANRWIPPNARTPVTAVMRFDGARAGMSSGKVRGVLTLYDDSEVYSVRVGAYTVPLESDPSAALAYRLQYSPLWDFEIAGFRGQDFSFLNAEKGDTGGLYMLHPYRPGLIPVVFVHGTASSPARWAEMANELLGDRLIASHYQLWFFIYNSGNPVALSAMRLREALLDVRTGVDPDGKDHALDRMVVIGHSQGGLLTKMTVVNSGSRFWDNLSNVPLDKADVDPETRDLLRRALFVKPLPFVKRVVFIATPHRGSFLASNFLGKIANKLINLPGALAKSAVQIGKLRQASMMGGPVAIPTALDNMDSSNPFLKTLVTLPIAPGVQAHSIIPVKGDGPAEEGNDGVVEYKSAHLDGVESELVVRSGHSTQGRPETIEEVRRILYEHAGIH